MLAVFLLCALFALSAATEPEVETSAEQQPLSDEVDSQDLGPLEEMVATEQNNFQEMKAEELLAEETEMLEAGWNRSADDVKTGVKWSCSSGWAPFGSRCFRFFNYRRNWAEAERYCRRFGANLVSIHSSFENYFVKVLIRRGTGQHARTWIGATDRNQNRRWYWSDRSRFNYSAWNRGEPNNLYGWGREACVEINYGDGKGWNDLRCWLKRPFVCST